MDTTDRLSLDQLAQAAGVSARQIRELIRLGVLPAPSSRGRGATYGEEHVHRLRVWKRFKEEAPVGTTNEQLRAMIEKVADQGLLEAIANGSIPFSLVDDARGDVSVQELASFSSMDMDAAPSYRRNDDALEYLRSLPAGRSPRGEASRVVIAPNAPSPKLEMDIRETRRSGPALTLRRLRDALERYVGATAAPVRVNPNKSETWHRVSATRDVEISARGPLTPDEIQLLESIGQLLQQAIYRKER